MKAGIRLEDFIKMTRLARETDSGAARFLDAWDALEPFEQEAPDAADAVCERLGLAPLKLLRAAADAACRFSTCVALLIAALSHPAAVEKTIDRALDDNRKDSVKHMEMLHKAVGFLPVPKGSQTVINIMQNAQPGAIAAEQIVQVERPEETIRRFVNRFNERHGLPPTPPMATPYTPGGMSLEGDEAEEGDD